MKTVIRLTTLLAAVTALAASLSAVTTGPVPSGYRAKSLSTSLSGNVWHLDWDETVKPEGRGDQGIVSVDLRVEKRVEGASGRDDFYQSVIMFTWRPPGMPDDQPDVTMALINVGESQYAAEDAVNFNLDIMKKQGGKFISATEPKTTLYSWVGVNSVSKTLPGEKNLGCYTAYRLTGMVLDIPLDEGVDYRATTEFYVSDHKSGFGGGGYNHYRYETVSATITGPKEPPPPRPSVVVTKTFNVRGKQGDDDVGIHPRNYTIRAMTLTITGPTAAFDQTNPYYSASANAYVVPTEALLAGPVALPFNTADDAQSFRAQLVQDVRENSTPDVNALKDTPAPASRFTIPASP